MLTVEQLRGGYGDQSIIAGVSFSVKKGEVFGILGPNGSGKTTLLKMLTGVHPFESGEVIIEGKPLKTYSTKALAKVMAVLPQLIEQSFTYTVREMVSLGRYPYQKGLLKTMSPKDDAKVNQALREANVAQFADKSIDALSGGEKQRAYLAQALAQEPKILLLDEPTNHLDLSHQKNLLDALKRWAEEEGLTVIAVFHDLNLASLYCDRLLLLEKGKVKAVDTPAVVLREQSIEEVYQTKPKRLIHPERSRPLMTILPEKTKADQTDFSLQQLDIDQNDEMIKISSPILFKTLSSAMIGSGFAWKNTFVNRHVDKNYVCDDPVFDIVSFLKQKQLTIDDTVAMMTAVYLENYSHLLITEELFELLVVVTAGVGNAVDVSQAKKHHWQTEPVGTINSWIFVNGHLSEEAFIQAMMTATEAKAKALFDERVEDSVTGTVATGTSTDSILIAASQRGTMFPYAGTITEIGKAIGEAIYTCTREAVQKTRKSVG